MARINKEDDGAANRLARRIERTMRSSSRHVFLPKDFASLSEPGPIFRALRTLMAQRKLLRLGKGVYAKARPSSLSDRAVLKNPAGFQAVAEEALNRLGVQWQSSDAQVSFAAGRSAQIPVNPVVKIKGRFARKLTYGNQALLVAR